ncbi:MAG TPA: hypothetical protein VG205_12595, partial [Acidimicrobiales bacterium]|nr:hypothetical protein [Acidimicrobiales bacterium]
MPVALAGWWVTGLRPFTITAYVAVGLPVAALVVAEVVRSRDLVHSIEKPGRATFTLGSVFPWVVLGALGIGLEGLGLALGGRSAGVPTLSTVVDHALVWHGLRFVLFCGWLAMGWVPALRWAFGVRTR